MDIIWVLAVIGAIVVAAAGLFGRITVRECLIYLAIIGLVVIVLFLLLPFVVHHAAVR